VLLLASKFVVTYHAYVTQLSSAFPCTVRTIELISTYDILLILAKLNHLSLFFSFSRIDVLSLGTKANFIFVFLFLEAEIYRNQSHQSSLRVWQIKHFQVPLGFGTRHGIMCGRHYWGTNRQICSVLVQQNDEPHNIGKQAILYGLINQYMIQNAKL